MLNIKKTNVILFFLVLLAFLAAVLQPFGVSPDYRNYELYFQHVRSDFLSAAAEYRFEPGFAYATGALTTLFANDVLIYGVLVAVSMSVKVIYLKRFAYDRYCLYLAYAFYAFRFFPLHELTQLRASLATSFMFVACFYLWRRKWPLGAGACAIGTSFHYSSFMLLPFFFLPKLGRKTSLMFAALTFVSLYLGAHFLITLTGEYLAVFESYELQGYGEETVNPLSPVFFPEFFMLSFSLYYWNKLTDSMQRIVTIELIGFAMLYALIDFPVVAVRGREFFAVLWTLFISQSAVCKSGVKRAVYIFVVASMALSLFQYIYLDFFGR